MQSKHLYNSNNNNNNNIPVQTLYTGIFSDEKILQLLRILQLLSESCFSDLHEVANEGHPSNDVYASKFKEGLNSIRTWPIEVKMGESSRAIQDFPELGMLYQYAIYRYVHELHKNDKNVGNINVNVPVLHDFIHHYFVTLAQSSYMQKLDFLKVYGLERTHMYMEALRTTLMDLTRASIHNNLSFLWDHPESSIHNNNNNINNNSHNSHYSHDSQYSQEREDRQDRQYNKNGVSKLQSLTIRPSDSVSQNGEHRKQHRDDKNSRREAPNHIRQDNLRDNNNNNNNKNRQEEHKHNHNNNNNKINNNNKEKMLGNHNSHKIKDTETKNNVPALDESIATNFKVMKDNDDDNDNDSQNGERTEPSTPVSQLQSISDDEAVDLFEKMKQSTNDLNPKTQSRRNNDNDNDNDDDDDDNDNDNDDDEYEKDYDENDNDDYNNNDGDDNDNDNDNDNKHISHTKNKQYSADNNDNDNNDDNNDDDDDRNNIKSKQVSNSNNNHNDNNNHRNKNRYRNGDDEKSTGTINIKLPSQRKSFDFPKTSQ